MKFTVTVPVAGVVVIEDVEAEDGEEAIRTVLDDEDWGMGDVEDLRAYRSLSAQYVDVHKASAEPLGGESDDDSD